MKRKRNRLTYLLLQLSAVFLFMHIITGNAVAGNAVSQKWEAWKPTEQTITFSDGDVEPTVLECPVYNVSDDTMLYYISEMIDDLTIDYGQSQENKRVYLRFFFHIDSEAEYGSFTNRIKQLKDILYWKYSVIGNSETTNVINIAIHTPNSTGYRYYYKYEIGYDLTIISAVNGNSLSEKVLEIADDAKKHSDTERGWVRYIYDYLTKNVTYDSAFLLSSTTYNTLFKQRAVCYGYSKTFTELCYLLDMPCLSMKSGTHSWSSVYLDGKWQMIDVVYGVFLAEKIDSPSHKYDTELYKYMKTLLETPPTESDLSRNAPEDKVRVVINGSYTVFDVPPRIVNGRTLVPLRFIFELMGANVEWDEPTQTVTATKGDTVVKLTIGSKLPTINGQDYPIDQPAVIINNRTLAPMRFVAEAFGGTVEWDEQKGIAYITTTK